jgi:hypothetical protein
VGFAGRHLFRGRPYQPERDQKRNAQRNTRAGFTVALPLDRQNSLKLSASSGLTTRTGSDFTAVGVAWQYRWGEGY